MVLELRQYHHARKQSPLDADIEVSFSSGSAPCSPEFLEPHRGHTTLLFEVGESGLGVRYLIY